MLNFLPPLLTLEDVDYDPNRLIMEAYRIFRKDFIDNKPYFHATPIKLAQGIGNDGKENTFWHIISGTDKKNNNFKDPNPNRIKYIRWISPIIANSNNNEILCFEKNIKKKKRILLWYKNEDYLVVLERRNNYIILWTAYPIEYPNLRNDLIKDYNNYIKAKGTSC